MGEGGGTSLQKVEGRRQKEEAQTGRRALRAATTESRNS